MLEFDGVTILLEIINFLIIAAALNFLLFKPVVKRAEAQRIERERLEAELKRDREEAAEKLAAINERGPIGGYGTAGRSSFFARRAYRNQS